MNFSSVKLNLCGLTSFTLVSLCILYFYTFYPKVPSTVSLKYLLAVSIDVAEMGGMKVKNVRLSTDIQEQSKGKTREGANDPLTAGDLQSHRVMVNGLRKLFPDVKVISEEHDQEFDNFKEVLPSPRWDLVNKFTSNDVEVSTADVTIWIDPLDATQEYTENLLQYVTTMVCVAVKGKPVIGVIHKPFDKYTAWAWVDHAVSPGLPFNSHTSNSAQSPVIIVSRSHAGTVKDFAASAFGDGTVIIPAGGAGYKVLQVIHGNATAYIHVTLIKKWDICAGNALLNALGGQMTLLSGQTIFYGPFDSVKNEGGLLATLHNHEQYLKTLKWVKSGKME